MAYNFTAIEKKWQQYWLANKSFAALDPAQAGAMPKKYILDMFPYPSGAGLHVGHPEGYTATDIVSRYFRMKGFNVLHPMGWDAFGLPAEQHAIRTGEHPRLTTEAAIKNFRRQIQMLGLSYDWDREVDTTDPAYYKWTQWIFLQLFNSYFDPIQQKAMPIGHLMNELVNENYVIAPDGSIRANPTQEGMERVGGEVRIERLWRELSEEEQAGVLESQRLAYQDEVPVNWCPGLGTVLSNEEVIDGKSEVGGYPVERRPMRQWMLRITAYADRLVKDLDLLDWPESLKEMQRNWIGKSTGAEVDFDVVPPAGEAASAAGSSPATDRTFEVEPGDGDIITVFTTRPDTLYGATYMVLAPEHPLVDKITTPAQQSAVNNYRATVASKSERDRMAETKEKTGVFTGAYAINPVNKEPIPVWIADYVLMGYGTGAIMAVPAHDERDFEFAKTFGLPIKGVVMPGDSWLTAAMIEKLKKMPMPTLFHTGGGQTVAFASMDAPTQAKIVEAHHAAIARAQATVNSMDEPKRVEMRADYVQRSPEWPCFVGEGTAINSPLIDGLPTADAKEKITSWLEDQGVGHRSIKYKLRDWLFSRQRYWGEPFPIVLDDAGNAFPLNESELPLTLPELSDFKPTGTPAPPLSKAKDWLIYKRADETFTRETNTMPQWAGSCWYYLRYIDPKNPDRFVDPGFEKYWMPVDLYIGGVEHAVLHLLYSRFWHKVLFDLGHVSTPEPFQRLVNQGLILGEMEYHFFEDAQGKAVSTADVKDIQEEATPAGTSLIGVSRQTGVKLTAKRIDEILVEKKGDGYVLKANPAVKVDAGTFKMSKSRGNVVNPDGIVKDYGADAFRLYEMYLGPLEAQKPWNTRDIVGMSRFLDSVWRNLIGEDREGVSPEIGSTCIADVELPDGLDRQLHRTIKKVAEDIEALRFNTAIAELIKLNNELKGLKQIPQWFAEQFVLLLAPFAPHQAEEIWRRLGHEQSLARHAWPTYDPAKLVESTMELPVQVNGKLRGKITVASDADQATILAAAKSDAAVQTWIAGKEIVKELYVPKKLVTFVVK